MNTARCGTSVNRGRRCSGYSLGSHSVVGVRESPQRARTPRMMPDDISQVKRG